MRGAVAQSQRVRDTDPGTHRCNINWNTVIYKDDSWKKSSVPEYAQQGISLYVRLQENRTEFEIEEENSSKMRVDFNNNSITSNSYRLVLLINNHLVIRIYYEGFLQGIKTELYKIKLEL